jgi:lipoyl(octanoyl) transferase
MVEWLKTTGPVAYEDAIEAMETRVAAIHAGTANELVWLLEHPPLYTAGTSSKSDDLIEPDRFPVYRTGRGGEFTYHGPGQRVAYVMLDLNQRGRDLHLHVHRLEEWAMLALKQFGVIGERRADRIGVWVKNGLSEDKIAAIGVRVRRWVSFHGIAINVAPNLSHYAGIVPCGIRSFGVTSLAQLGVPATLGDLDGALRTNFEQAFESAKG